MPKNVLSRIRKDILILFHFSSLASIQFYFILFSHQICFDFLRNGIILKIYFEILFWKFIVPPLYLFALVTSHYLFFHFRFHFHFHFYYLFPSFFSCILQILAILSIFLLVGQMYIFEFWCVCSEFLFYFLFF